MVVQRYIRSNHHWFDRVVRNRLSTYDLIRRVIEDPPASSMVPIAYTRFHNLWVRFALRRLIGSNVDKYFRDLQSKHTFHQYLQYASELIKAPLGGFIGSAAIYVICRTLKPEIVLETGVAHGYGSSHILLALRDNQKGSLYSIDLPTKGWISKFPDKCGTGWLIPSELKVRWKLIVGRSSERLLPLLKKLQHVDIFLHDSEHTYESMMFEYTTVWPFLKSGGILVSDDVDLNYAFYDFCRKVRRKPAWLSVYYDGIRK